MAGDPIPPPYFITADDKRGLIVVTAAIVASFVWTCFLIRLWLRFTSREWRLDDWFLAAATVLCTVESGIVFRLVDLGLGLSSNEAEASRRAPLGRETLAVEILYVCTLFASKCSILLLYLRLAPAGSNRIASWALLGLSAAWALVSVVLVSVPCNAIQYYTQGRDGCANPWPKFEAFGVLDIITEFLVFLIAVHLVWSLQMRLRTKLMVIFAFSARLPVIIAASIRLYYLHERFVNDNDTFGYVVATQWQMGYAIMSSTITGMGPFLRPFNKELVPSYRRYAYGQDSIHHTGTGTSSNHQRRSSGISQSYLMNPIPSHLTSNANPELNDVLDPDTSRDTTPKPSGSLDSQAPIVMTADEYFRPTDRVLRHDAEVWVGDRSQSLAGVEDAVRGPDDDESRLVISKRTELKIEVDRASRVV